MRVRNSYIWAVVILVAITGWLASGILIRGDVATGSIAETSDETASTGEERMAVRVTTLTASDREQSLTIRGRSEAVRRVALKAETAGQVTATPHAKGSFVRSGAPICTIETGERQAMLSEAQAAVDQAKLDYEAAVRLKEKGYTAAIEEASRKARLDAAKAAQMQAEIEIKRTRIRAPFDGVIEDQDAKVGAFLGTGDVCATLVELDPMLVVGSVSERDVGKISVGMAGTASLVTGETVEGKIRYIAASADPATRTFRVEFEAGNPGRKLRDGVTANLEIPLAPISAHLVSPAILTLDDNGSIGVRTVTPEGKVEFVAVAIIADGADGMWVTGLPDEATVITVGQEYVRTGQLVKPVSTRADLAQ